MAEHRHHHKVAKAPFEVIRDACCEVARPVVFGVGIILLVGLVKKNGIMMVDFALDATRRQGLGPVEAIRQAALLRFRPILMTTLAALFGALPLMLS